MTHTGLEMVLAHFGGIDEIGVFVVPVVLDIMALRWVDKRVRMRQTVDEDEGSDVGPETLDDRM